MSLTATVTGSSTPTSPTVQNVSTCCGTCGYVNCPMQLMTQSPASMPKLAGQLYGSGSAGAADAVNEKSMLGASISQSMAAQIIMPAAEWDRSMSPPPAGVLPGGGGTVSVGTRVGILSGQVAQSRSSPLTPPVGPVNAITLENQKPGNPESEWGIDGAGDDNIEGFATDISVNHGTTVNFKIDTDSNNYRIDIYRLGYYGGLGARKVATIQHTGVQNQPDPLRRRRDRRGRRWQLGRFSQLGCAGGRRLGRLHRQAHASGRNAR